MPEAHYPFVILLSERNAKSSVSALFAAIRSAKHAQSVRNSTQSFFGALRVANTLLSDRIGKYQMKKLGQNRHCTALSAVLLLYQKLIDIKNDPVSLKS